MIRAEALISTTEPLSQARRIVGEHAVNADLGEVTGEVSARLVVDRVDQDGDAGLFQVGDDVAPEGLRGTLDDTRPTPTSSSVETWTVSAPTIPVA